MTAAKAAPASSLSDGNGPLAIKLIKLSFTVVTEEQLRNFSETIRAHKLVICDDEVNL